ncbi:STAS domain-containing protein [Sorangium sp. So ce1097]|uniref:STAS domain-containing protein n=1 Tax=Sorangium sp. So ce1097 TaxID=3133330 RepID=UPI003F6297F2
MACTSGRNGSWSAQVAPSFFHFRKRSLGPDTTSVDFSPRPLPWTIPARPRHVIVDLAGVDVVDTSTADRFLRLARSVHLLGARCILTGAQPDVSAPGTDRHDVEQDHARARLELSYSIAEHPAPWAGSCGGTRTAAHPPKPISAATVKQVIGLLRQMLDDAMPQHITANPVAALKKRVQKAPSAAPATPPSSRRLTWSRTSSTVSAPAAPSPRPTA